MDLVHKLVGGVGKTKPTPICPFLFHMYESQGLLTKEEETDYRIVQELVHYRITPKPESESISVSDDEVREISAPEQRVQQPEAQQPPQRSNRTKRMKHTYRAPEGSPLVQSRGKGSRPQLDHPRPEARLEP